MGTKTQSPHLDNVEFFFKCKSPYGLQPKSNWPSPSKLYSEYHFFIGEISPKLEIKNGHYKINQVKFNNDQTH
jgi:hypothetical protein